MQLAFILQDLQHQNQISPDQMQQIERMATGLAAAMPMLIVLSLALLMLPFWFILKRAGFSPWLTLLNVLPFGTLILLYILAFAHWRRGHETGTSELGYPYAHTPPRP